MRRAHQIFAYLLAGLVVVQAMSIAYGLAGLSAWVEDGHDLTKALLDDHDSLHFAGTGGFMIHGMSGTMIIPLVTIVFLIISLFAKVPGGARRAGILFVLVAVQVFLGLTSHDVAQLAPLHALNAFAIFSMAVVAGQRAGEATTTAEPAATS